MTLSAVCVLAVSVLLLCIGDGPCDTADLPAIPGLTLTEADVRSSVDGEAQPVVIGVPDAYREGAPTPLLVGLHTWSAEYTQMVAPYGKEAAKRGWLLVCPHYRGPNLVTNPQATQAGGSILAQHDIIDAIEHVKGSFAVDDRRIYMTGGSGGGHMTCLMASKYPDVFAACAAWCPITDLRDWRAQQNSYAQHIEAVCGGKPGDGPEVDFEYARRSPRTLITNAAHTHLLIGHGDKDPSVWPQQSWETFRELSHIPYHKVLFESWSAGHVAKTAEGLDWAATKRRSLAPPTRLDIVTDEPKSYFWLHLTPAAPFTLASCTAILIRAGDRIDKDEFASETTLTLEATDLAEARVDLEALRVRPPKELPRGVRSEGCALIIQPGPGHHEYAISL